MKYKLSELIKEINSKNPNWTEKRTSWFINSVRDKTSNNYNALTRSDRKAISELSDSGLEAYVGSLLGEYMTDVFDIEEIIKPIGINSVIKFLKVDECHYILSDDFIYQTKIEDSKAQIISILDLTKVPRHPHINFEKIIIPPIEGAHEVLYAHWNDWKKLDKEIVQKSKKVLSNLEYYQKFELEELIPQAERIQELQNEIEDIRIEAIEIKSSAIQEVENIYTLVQSMNSEINISDSTVLVENLENRLSVDKKLELLEDRLARGEISEETYHSIAERYQN